MKIGIVSIFDSENMGNRLQNYALQQVLKRYTEQVVTFKNKPKPGSLKEQLKRKSPLAESILTNRLIGKTRKAQLLRFNKKYIPTTKTMYWNNPSKTAIKAQDRCDFYCAGSDQVWNPLIGRGSFDYLRFAQSEQTFSYAASFGIDEIPEAYREAVAAGLKHIKHISVREDAGKKIVEDLTGRADAQVLVDPTMLLTCQDWDRVIAKPQGDVSQNYVLTYFLGAVSEERKAAIQARARELGCELIELMDPAGPFYAVGPDGFVWLIKNARYICTDSFHGSVFSFLYGRPFAVFAREDSGPDMGSRIKTFMSKFSLQACAAAGNILPDYCAEPDYSTGYAALEAERSKSGAFLNQVFQTFKG